MKTSARVDYPLFPIIFFKYTLLPQDCLVLNHTIIDKFFLKITISKPAGSEVDYWNDPPIELRGFTIWVQGSFYKDTL